MRRACILAILALAAMGFRFVPMKNVSSADNQAQAGPALPLINVAQDADTDCSTTASDMGGSTDATADLTCANTGEIVVAGFDQAAVTIALVRVAGTAVIMQCDVSHDNGSTWAPIMTESNTGAKSVRTWTWTSSVSGRISHHFNVCASRMRCRSWVTSGTSDTVKFNVRLGSSVGG